MNTIINKKGADNLPLPHLQQIFLICKSNN